MYLLHILIVRGDNALEKLFTALPRFALLGDIDAVGIKNRGKDNDSDHEDDISDDRRSSSVTLSGLLNVLDGIAS